MLLDRWALDFCLLGLWQPRRWLQPLCPESTSRSSVWSVPTWDTMAVGPSPPPQQSKHKSRSHRLKKVKNHSLRLLRNLKFGYCEWPRYKSLNHTVSGFTHYGKYWKADVIYPLAFMHLWSKSWRGKCAFLCSNIYMLLLCVWGGVVIQDHRKKYESLCLWQLGGLTFFI